MAVPFSSMRQTANMAKKLAKNGIVDTTIEEIKRFYGGASLNHVALEYLLSSSVFPLGIIMQLFGIEGCGKTTLALSLLQDYFLTPGGDGKLIETEQKFNATLVDSIIYDEEAKESKRFDIKRTDSLEKTQTALTVYGTELNTLTFGKRRDDLPHLLGMVVDSYRVPSETTQDSVLTSGHATKNYAVEANLWRAYLGTFMKLLQYAPMSLIVVNHLVEKDGGAYGKVNDVGGGMALKFFETYRILVKTINKKVTKELVYSDLSLTTYKNSNGPNKQTVYPRIVYKSPDIPAGRTIVDWSIADAKLLTSDAVPRSKLSSEGICNVTESSKAGLYNDTVNNLKMVPIEEITAKLYEDEDKLAAFRKLLGISKNRTLEELYEDGWFKDAKGAPATSNDDED